MEPSKIFQFYTYVFIFYTQQNIVTYKRNNVNNRFFIKKYTDFYYWIINLIK